MPEPCRGCRFAERCRAERMACDSAAGWAAGLPELRWRMAPRAPTRARLEAIIEIEQRQRRERAAQSQGSSRRWQEPKSAVIREPGIRIGEISRELEKAPSGKASHSLPSAGKSKSATLRDAGISTATAHRAEQLAAVATPLQIAAPGASCAVDVGKENAPEAGALSPASGPVNRAA